MSGIKEILGIVAIKKSEWDSTILIRYNPDFFQEIRIYNRGITNKELTKEEYNSRLEELKEDPNCILAGGNLWPAGEKEAIPDAF